MAKFNEILVGRYNRFLQKLLSMKGSASMSQLAAEMQPVFPFFNGAENRYLEGWDRFAFGLQQAGVALVTSTIKLRNPVGSNVICVFEKIAAATGTPDAFLTLQAGTDQSDGGTPVAMVAAQNLDSRSLRVSSLIASRSGAASPPSQVAWAAANTPANTMYDFISTDSQELTLNPGRSLQVVTNNANEVLTCSFIWRERLLEDSERT